MITSYRYGRSALHSNGSLTSAVNTPSSPRVKSPIPSADTDTVTPEPGAPTEADEPSGPTSPFSATDTVAWPKSLEM